MYIDVLTASGESDVREPLTMDTDTGYVSVVAAMAKMKFVCPTKSVYLVKGICSQITIISCSVVLAVSSGLLMARFEPP